MSPEATARQSPREPIARRVARDLGLDPARVAGALALFAEGATLPFVARYRKEATGGLDEVQLRDVQERAAYLEALEARRAAILESLSEQGVLSDALRRAIESAGTKQDLEDLYLPYKPKRRTRATMAVERGLEPLADAIDGGALDDARALEAAGAYVDPARDVPDRDAALQGARDILAERLAHDAELRRWVRELTRRKGCVASKAARGKRDDPAAARFRDYLEHEEPIGRVAGHRILAMRRGKAEGVLQWGVELPEPEALPGVEARALRGRRARDQMLQVARDAYARLISPSIESELKSELEEAADREAIAVFGSNLEQLLLQPPAGERAVLGLDPGFRTGVKAAMVSPTGAVLETATLYLHQEDRFRAGLRRLVARHAPELIAVGNGTASRETEAAVRDALRGEGAADAREAPAVVQVSEAGASVYSASDVAREELPDLDVSLRGAVSIARRLQDPLAELVKIDPRSIGVGQYQHDVDGPELRKRLDETVVRCVNRVGVEVNTASPALLSYVAGIGPTLARNIVHTRDERGGFRSRRALLEVPRLGARAFEQSAGFLRVRGATHPLDATGVHPERYALVERMAKDAGAQVTGLLGDEARLASLEARLADYVSADVGLPTLRDILEELRRPGRDPREAFEPPAFRDDVQKPEDLVQGMTLEGVVTNVVAFGAFVDVGMHQDGLVHVSQLADRYVKDPSEVVRVGQRVRVRVLEVDLERRRIALSMKTG